MSSRRKLQSFYNVIWKVTYFLFFLIVLVLRPTLIICWRNYTKVWISAEDHWGANLKAKIRTAAMVLDHWVRTWWHGDEDWEKKIKLWDIYNNKNLIVNLTTLRYQGLKEDFRILNLDVYKSDLATNWLLGRSGSC